MSRLRFWPAVVLPLAVGCGSSAPTHQFADDGKTPAEFREMLTNPDPAVRTRGAFGLSRGGAKDAVPQLADRLQDNDAGARQAAAAALATAGPDAGPAVPALTAALKDPEWAVRRQAAVALGAVGPAAKPAGPALRGLEKDPSGVVRTAAAEARRKINGK